MNVNRADISQLLTQMREMKSQAQGVEGPAAGGEIQRPQGSQKAGAPQFGDMFKSAIDSVNEMQKTSGQLAQAYERGDSQVSLTQVMVASQKASVSFQAVSQVRNRLVEAYKDVMNMPV